MEPVGAVQFNVVEKGEGYAKIGLSEMDADLEPGSDAALVADGWATVTALRPVCQADDVDVPSYPESHFEPRGRGAH